MKFFLNIDNEISQACIELMNMLGTLAWQESQQRILLNVPDNHNYFFLLYLCHHRYCEISQACPSNHINKYYYHIKMQGKN